MQKIIHILGLGESLDFFKNDGNITIGVNDINRLHLTDHVVIVDPIRCLTDENKETVKKSDSQFWSQLDEYNGFVKKFNKIELCNGRGLVDDFDSEKFVYSITSPFVAVHLAYKLGATDIIMWGVDFNYARCNDEKDIEPMDALRQERALKDFLSLKNALNSRGVNFYVGNEISLFNKILPCWRLS